MAFFQEHSWRSPIFLPLVGATPLGSHLILWLHPPLISERLPLSWMKGIVVWSQLEVQVSLPQLGGVVGLGLLIGVAGWVVVAKRATNDTFPISNCKGYMSTPQTSTGQACKATPHPSRKKWQSHPSFSMALHSKSCIFSSRDHSKVWVQSAQAVFASLVVAVHLASASQIVAVQRALPSLMAVLVLDTSLLWWESMEALVVSSCPMATFISPCS